MLPAQANITDDLVVTISAPKNYDAGSSVKYTLTIKNNSEDTTYKNIKLNAAIADITTMLDSGVEGSAFSSVSNKVDTIGDNSDAGVFNTSGNLVSTNIVVAPSESITYIITAKTVENAIGDINTSDHVSFKKGFWFKKELDAVVTHYLQPDVSITKTVANSAYQTGKKITYTVVVENAAHAGTARNYHVIDTLSSIQSQAANNNIDDNNNWSHTDEDKSSPFTTWDIAVAVENDADSSLSSPLKDADLDDTVTLPAKGKITYTVTATTTAVAIAEISNKALLLDAKKQQIAETALVNTNTQLVSKTQNTKRVIESEYSPGNEITYKLRVKNTDKHKFANNITLLDKLMTCPTTTQSTGADDAPFEYWYIDSIDAQNTDKGTDAGVAANNPSAHRTDDINFVVDLAPNSYIEYTIKAKVKDTTIGHIQDSNACGDDFDESGSGIDMPKGKIQIKKSVDQDKFTPGEDITYTIEVKNPSNGLLLDIPVVDKLDEITAENADGKMVYPFVEGSIRVTTDQGEHSNPDVNGDLNKNPIDVKATIFPNESVKYIVTAKTKQDIVGVISNTAYAGEGKQQGKSTVITTPRLENLNIEKHVKGANSDGWRAYGYNDDEFTYTIKVTNPAPAGFAKNVTVTDAISQIKAELLEKAGEEVPVFTSWTVSTATDGGAEVVKAPENNKDLESVVNVPADGSVTFTVTAQIDPRRKDHVIWGKFTNQAQAKLARTGEVIKTANVDVVPAEPRLRLRKLVSNSVYTVGQPLEYTIDIQNYDRDGYVNDGRVSDSISSLSIFDQWKVWWEVIDDEKNPATVDRGQGTELFGYPTSEASASESTKDINNARFDLAPHQTLRIHVKGLVSEKAVGKGKITNVVTATDNAGDHFDASVDVNEDNTSVNSISIYKYGDPDFKRYHPGDKYTWTVRVVNNSANAVDNVVVNDKIIGIDVLLANNGDNKYADITGTPYRSWTITKQVGEGSEEHFSDDVDLHDELKLAKKGEAGDNATYRITAIIKDNVVDEWLNNVADVTYLTLRNGKMEPIIAYAKASVQRASTGGDVTRHLNETQYIPGKTKIVYTITASSNLGYMNNKAILENLEGLTVKTINKDGTTSEGNPFDHGSGPEFTVSVEKSEVTGHDVPSTSTDGTLDGTVADNKNIDTTIDVAPKDKVIYTVTGTVRDDAVGDITFNNDPDLVVEPYEPKLEIEKKVDQKSYEPGKPLHYTLTVKNTGKAHAFDVHVKDLLADVKVLDVNGNQAPAFSSVTTTDKYSGEYKTWYFAGHYDQAGSINTTDTIIPLGGTAVYSVNAVVNKDAVGPITNALDVNGNTTEVVTNPVTAKYIANKTIVAYYDDEKNKLPDLKGYMPGGYIEYQVTVTNQSTANIDDLSIKDDLSTITAKTVDGGEEPVFDDVLIDYAFARQDAFSKVAGFASTTQVLDTTVDIGPENAVTFNIKAHIKPTIVGTFQNEANIGDRLHPKSPISRMLPANVELTKIVMDSAGKEIKTYQPGQKIQYKIELSNKGYGTSYTVVLKDELSKLLTNVAELSGDGKQDPTATPFNNWAVNEPVFEGGITTIPLTTGQNDIKAKAVLAPKVGKITILVDATISDDALGDITNTAVFGKKSDDAVLTPEPKDIRASKNVIELDDKPFTSNSYYLPGQKATYEIKVQNSSNNWANDITVKDVVSHVNVDVAGDKNEPAYSNYRITYRVEGGVSGLPDTFVPVNTPLDNKQLDTELDIAPQQIVYFTVEAMIKDTAVGVIEPNHAFVNGLDSTSQEIPPQSSGFVIHKKVADEDKTFTPGQEINYTITVENTGDAWLNDLPIKDELTAITADIAHDATSPTEGAAFSSVSVEAKASDGSFVTSNASDNIDAIADIKPKGSVTFTVTAVVADNVISAIDNTAYAGSDNTPSEKVTITPKQGDFELTKIADTETYVTGQEVTYSVTLNNSSDAWISDISLQDQVSKIVADSHAGVKAPAFDASSINFTWASEGAIKSFVDVNSVNESATVSLAPKGKVIFTIKAKVADNIVGDITNEATANDKTADVTITPKASEFDIHKAADIETFVPGQVVTYTVTVNNTGGTWLDDLPIKDDLQAIQTDVIGTSGSKEKGNAFSAIEVTASATPDSTVTNTAADTIDATADIKPQGSVTFMAKATVAANVIGNIDNTAHAGNDNTPSETVTITPESGDFTLTKIADTDTFIQGQLITYTVTLSNDSDSWVMGVQLKDEVSKIESLDPTGTKVAAFDPATISSSWRSEGSLDSYAEVLAGSESAMVTIAPHGKVIFTIKANVASDVVGDITNIAQADDKSEEVTITSVEGEFIIKKEVNKPIFVPEETMTYTLTLKNDSDAWVTNVKVTDAFDHIETEVADGKTGLAFNPSSIKVTSGKVTLGDGYIKPNPDGSASALVDLAPKSEAVITIDARVAADVVGDITNTAYANEQASNEVIIHPEQGDFVIHKKVADEDKTFTPGQEINYTITVENTGDAWLNDLPIKDALTSITADIAHDATSPNEGAAFSSVSVAAKASDGSFVTSNALDNIDAVADIKPKGSVTFTVTAVVADNVIGAIDNTAYAGEENTPSETVTITPKQGDFELTKTADTEIYVTGQEVTYSVTLSNSSDAWISDISLQDQVSKIVADSHAGVKAPAFDASSINFAWASEGAIKSFVDANSANESATVSLAPKGKVIFTIKAKVADNIVGDITNEAIANDKTADVTITPKASEFDIHKVADIETFVPGQVVTYTVTVNNTGGTWLDDLLIKDDLKAIQTDVIGTSGSKEKGNAFSAIEVTVSATPDSTVTNTAGDTIDATADIKPQGSVTFTVKATVAANVIGNIDNTAHAGNDNTPSETVTITPESGDFTLTKTADIAEFVTGQEVTYVVTLENSSDSWITDIQLSDKVSKIMALSHDGNDENAFESSSISYEWHVKGTDKSYIESDLANESAVVNLAPKGIVDLTIKAKVAENVVGDITNVATANDKTAEVTIDPKSGDFTITKSVNKATFVPGKPVTYTVTVKNTGGTWLDNFPIKDDLKAIEADIAHSASSPVKGVAFNTVSVVAKASDGSSVTNSVTDNIDAIADIKPDGDVTFTVEATVADNVIGAIDNTAYAGEENTPSETVTITPEQGDFALTKSADTDTFIQGQKITYTVTLSNDSDSWVTDVPLKDEVSKIEAVDPTGTKVAAFDPATIKVSATSEGSLDSFVDINTASESAMVSLAPHGKVHFNIEANVASNIVGDITNVAMAGNKSAEATITPTQGEFTLEKAVNKPTFVPNDTMTYILTLKNNSEAWVTNVKVTDAFNTITTELAGHRTGVAFDKSSIKVTSGKITAGEGYVKLNPDGSASALVDLAPNSEAVITVDAQVASDVVGNIANTAYANDQASNEVVITPEASEITIEKTADISEFVPGQTVNYTVTVNNTKASWATGVNIKDEVSKIEAEIAGGTPTSPLTGSAFDANSIVTKIADLGDSKVVRQESNESIILDIAPNASVTVNIAANVNKNVIGSITNIAHAIDNNGDDHNAEVTIEPIEGAVILTKEAIYATYKNGGEVGFDIKVENTGAGFAAHVELQDLISKIEATTNLGQPTPALTHWKVSYVAGDENTKVMDVALNKLKQNLPEDKDVNVVMDIAPQDTVTFTVMGTAADDIVDDITNTASMTFGENKQDATATVKPEQTSFEATKASVESYYTINKDLSFELTITNTSDNIINDMVVNDDMSAIAVKYRDGSTGPAFVKGSTKFIAETVPQGAQVEAQTESQFLVDLLPKQTITFKVTGKVVDSANGMIQNIAQVNDQDVPSNFVPPLEPEITGTIVTTTDYDDDNVGEDENIYVPGGTVIYTITLENNTDAFANNVGFMSEFSKVSSEDYNGRQIHAYTDWKIATKATGTERGTTVGSYTDGKDVQTGLHIAPHSKVVYTFTTQVDKDLVNVIDYAAFYIDKKVIGHIDVHNLSVTKLESEVKPMLPEYDLKLTKTASKATAQVGDVVEYEVMVENDNKANFYDVSVVDHYPAGFQYVPGSTQIVHSGPDGEFDTKDDQSLSQEPVMSGQLTFRKVNLKSNEKVRVRYLMRVSTGVTFGKYVNTAVAQIRGEDKSNVDKAVVEIEADKLFDTASIIGKVFEDLNGDGFQADATAKGITVKTDLPKGDYVANSTTLMRDGKTTVVSDAKQVAPISSGITVKTLMGQSQNRTLKQGNKAVIRFKTTTATPFAFSVTTSNGTHVHFGTDGKITRTLTGDTKQGLSAENLNVTRNLYQAKTGYVWEIVIENLGIYEDGIPGVRLITTEGIKIETDQFGRYHIPDQWVKDKKGKNFLVKVDTDSLPTGMKVISENPKVQRITPNALAKFNFSVQTKH
ncbi:hypothetical protein [Photobacterium leiognathi]|uniref:hypothetical protein n=1 Tax=Photobacterium leiognathi TaxID=553611 RepID=UPI0029828539|nr:hypothetical protein [Photobacterium leiognathi]